MSKTIIFGATGHIGSALAHELHQQGKPLHLAGRNKSGLSALAGSLGASFSEFDAMDNSSISETVAEADSDGALGGLVWAVGSILLKPLSLLSQSDIQTCFQLNLFGAMMAAKSALPSLKAGQGSILLFSSVAAQTGFNAHTAIGSAKAAIEGLVVALAAEAAPEIRVNAIAPSLSESKMAAPLMANPQMQKALAATHPLGRLGRADDFTALASLLLDNRRAGWITGQIFAVDGGRSSVQVNSRGRS